MLDIEATVGITGAGSRGFSESSGLGWPTTTLSVNTSLRMELVSEHDPDTEQDLGKDEGFGVDASGVGVQVITDSLAW